MLCDRKPSMSSSACWEGCRGRRPPAQAAQVSAAGRWSRWARIPPPDGWCPRPMTEEIGMLSSKKFLFTVAPCLDGLENGNHVSPTETERTRLAIERVADIEQWRGDARLASRFGD